MCSPYNVVGIFVRIIFMDTLTWWTGTCLLYLMWKLNCRGTGSASFEQPTRPWMAGEHNRIRPHMRRSSVFTMIPKSQFVCFLIQSFCSFHIAAAWIFPGVPYAPWMCSACHCFFFGSPSYILSCALALRRFVCLITFVEHIKSTPNCLFVFRVQQRSMAKCCLCV